MEKIRDSFFLTAILLLVWSAAHAETADQIKALDRSWAEATMHADVAALNRMLADDLTYTHTSGETQNKAEFIASVRDGKIRYDSIEFEEASARVYGNTAVTTSNLGVKVTMYGREVSLHPRFLHVWVKKDGRWQLVAHQATKLD